MVGHGVGWGVGKRRRVGKGIMITLSISKNHNIFI